MFNNDDDIINNLIMFDNVDRLNAKPINEVYGYEYDDKNDNDDDDDTRGAMGSNHRPVNQMYLNKNNSPSYICSIISPPEITINNEYSSIIQVHDQYSKYNETYKFNMRRKYQDILDKISNKNLDSTLIST